MNTKTMLAISALCAAVAANAEISSANIVGYGPTTLPADGLSVGPSFVTMSASGVYDLMDVSVVGYDDSSLGDVQVQTLTGSGGTDKTYAWFDYVDDESGDRIKGWFDPDHDYEPLERGVVTIAVGEGLWSVTMASGLSLQTAGQVATDADIPLALPADGLTIANPTPVEVDLFDCYVNGYDEVSLGDVQAQTLTGSGGTDKTYAWFDYVDDESGDHIYGWFDPDHDYEPLEEDSVTVAPGEGLWSVTMANGLNFVWPKVDL